MYSAKLGEFTVYYENGEEYHRIKREVWGANGYYVEIEKDNPVIIDGGAHIGVTTLYFKRIFPDSTIIAVEPHPANADLFRKNMYENQIENVELIEAAIAEHTGNRELYYDSTDEGWYSTSSFTPGAWNNEQVSESMTVPTVMLGTLLQTHQPDLVKLDIEGAEDKVLYSAREQLTMCPHYLIEFHPVEGVGMNRIVSLFQEHGYEVTVTKGGTIVPWQKAVGLSLIEATRYR